MSEANQEGADQGRERGQGAGRFGLPRWRGMIFPWAEAAANDRFQKFSTRARKALMLAQEEALLLHHNYIGTEHLLLGLRKEADGVAAQVLRNLGVELDTVRASVEKIVGRGDRAVVGAIGLTPRSKKVLELAVDEARRLQHGFIGTEHLLLGLVREGEGVGAGILNSLGISPEKIREETIGTLAKATREDPRSIPKNNILTCRLDDRDLDAIDDLVEAGIRTTRSDAAAWLIHAGIEANGELLRSLHGTVSEIRRLREVAQSLAQQVNAGSTAGADSPVDAPSAEAGDDTES